MGEGVDRRGDNGMTGLAIGFLLGLVILAFAAPWAFYWIDQWFEWIDRKVGDMKKRKWIEEQKRRKS